jgi:hypothetical protein
MMMDVNDELLDRFLDGEASNDESAHVIAWLESNHNMKELVERAEIHSDLRRSLQRRSIQQEALKAVSADAQKDTPEPRLVQASDRPRKPRLGYAIFAIGLATAASLAVMFLSPSEPNAPIARIAYQSNACWRDQERSQGDAIGTGVLRLDAGIVRLNFANGATITLQGPAKFEILDTNQTRLNHGILTAHIPGSAIGFEVLTPSLDVVDLGTAFGVSVGADGETDVCVFEGEVEVTLSGRDPQSAAQRIMEGKAVRTRAQDNSIENVAYETNRYEDVWPINSGVLQTTGLMKFVSPGPDFVPGRYEDSEHILVFPERSGVLLESDLLVDLDQPGQYHRIHRKEKKIISAGRRVRSYLLQFDPIGRLQKKDPNKTRVMGQLTFDRPIVGLIGSTAKLDLTDDVLGHPRGEYSKTQRGIEPTRPADLPDSGRDVVTLSQDRRTLSLDLSAGSAVDQIRIVVQASWAE